jgi:hypothetical protein
MPVIFSSSLKTSPRDKKINFWTNVVDMARREEVGLLACLELVNACDRYVG